MATRTVRAKRPTKQGDAEAARELVLYIDNTSDLSLQGPSGQGNSVARNAFRRFRKGTYNPELAVKLFGYLVETGAKRYTKEFGSDAPIFDPATRLLAAKELEQDFRRQAENGEFDHLERKSGVRESVVRESEEITARTVHSELGKILEHEGRDAARESARIARLINSAGRNQGKVQKALEEINKILDGHGVEALRDENAWDSYYGDAIAEYVNMGDTYAATVLYDVREREWHVTSWGDWYEAYEQNRDSEGETEERRGVRENTVRARRAGRKPDQRAVDFFFKHAGSSYTPGKETPEQGQRRGAIALANAEQEATARGWRVEWTEDPGGWDSLGDIDPDTVKEVLQAILYDEQGNVIASLGSIVDPDRNYGRVIEAELALEALPGSGVSERRGVREDDDKPTRDTREIILYDEDALNLMEGWWNGQSDPLYAIHSMGGAHEAWVFEDAIDNLDHEIGRVKPLGKGRFQLGKGTFTKKEIDELHTIRDALAAALESETGKVLETSQRSVPGVRGVNAQQNSERYVLYYTDGRVRDKIWYARKAPGDGGKDWEYTDDPSKAGSFSKRHLQQWVALHGRKSGWRFADGRLGEHTVRDYEVIDRRDRRIAGPYKSQSDARAKAGPGDVVRYVPKGKRR